jgi:hypothetical protein
MISQLVNNDKIKKNQKHKVLKTKNQTIIKKLSFLFEADNKFKKL